MSKENAPQDHETVSVNGVVFSFGEIFRVVDDFYHRIQQDPVLQVPFQSVGDWPHHIDRLTQFWWIRLGGKSYMFSHYNPVVKHFFAGFNTELLKRWLALFRETLKTHLNEEQALLWGSLAERMGEALTVRNEIFRREHEAKNT